MVHLEGVDQLADLRIDLPIAILDHKMSVAMWNCHCWPLDVSAGVCLNCHSWPIGVSSQGSVKLPFGIGRGGGSISQSRFGCHVVCTDIQGISAWLPGGPSAKAMFICQVWHSGIQGKYSQFRGGVHLPKSVFLPSVVYWYSRYLCSICGGSICQSEFVCQVLCTGMQGISALLPMGVGGRSARRSAKISFNNNIKYYSWQIWTLRFEICNCVVGVALGVSGECWGRLHLTWLCNTNWLFTTIIIQK